MIVFETLKECESALDTINNYFGYPNENTQTWDTPHEVKGGQFAIESLEDELMEKLGFINTDLEKRKLLDYRKPDNFKVDETKLSEKINDEIYLYSEIKNYYEGTLTLVYVINGEKKEFVQKVDDLSYSKEDYSIDIEKKLKEAEAISASSQLVGIKP